jgi:hypothetical protein
MRKLLFLTVLLTGFLHAQDAATKSYVDSNVGTFYTKEQVDALISNLQDQINQVNGETTY